MFNLSSMFANEIVIVFGTFTFEIVCRTTNILSSLKTNGMSTHPCQAMQHDSNKSKYQSSSPTLAILQSFALHTNASDEVNATITCLDLRVHICNISAGGYTGISTLAGNSTSLQLFVDPFDIIALRQSSPAALN